MNNDYCVNMKMNLLLGYTCKIYNSGYNTEMINSLVASPMCPIGNPEILSTSNFYDGNVIYVVWKDKLA